MVSKFLLNNASCRKIITHEVLLCGDVICTSGGVPHYGPSLNSFCAVLFGAASPIEKKFYQVDNQYYSLPAYLFVIQCAWDDADKISKRWLLFQLIKMVSNHGGRSCFTIDSIQFVSGVIMEFIHQAIKNGIVEEGMMLSEDKLIYLVDKFLSKYSTAPMADIFHHNLMNIYCKEYTVSDAMKRCITKINKNNTKITMSYSTKISSQHMVDKELL